MIAIGWPVTEAQREHLGHAEALARSATIVLDAFLVPSPKEIASRMELDDEVTVDAGTHEERRIRRALGAE